MFIMANPSLILSLHTPAGRPQADSYAYQKVRSISHIITSSYPPITVEGRGRCYQGRSHGKTKAASHRTGAGTVSCKELFSQLSGNYPFSWMEA